VWREGGQRWVLWELLRLCLEEGRLLLVWQSRRE